MQYAIAASLIACNNNPLTPEYTELGPELLGDRFLIGLVSLPDAEEFDLDTAALQTYASPENETDNASQFAAGRLFVSPTASSLKAAAALMQPDPSVGSWVFPYTDFPGNAKAKGAYPGTMLLSADVPTKGLPEGDAGDYGKYLSFAATTGQAQGFGVGQLPAGYVPIKGLSDEVDYTKAAAADVAAQNGQVPPLVPVSTPPSTTTTTTTTPHDHDDDDDAHHDHDDRGPHHDHDDLGPHNHDHDDDHEPPPRPRRRPWPPPRRTTTTTWRPQRPRRPWPPPRRPWSPLLPWCNRAPRPRSLPPFRRWRPSARSRREQAGIGGLALPLALLFVALGGVWSAVVVFLRRRRART